MQSLTKVPCFSVFHGIPEWPNSPICTADCHSFSLHLQVAESCQSHNRSQLQSVLDFNNCPGATLATVDPLVLRLHTPHTHTCTHVIACHYICTQTYTTYTTHTTVPFNTFYYLYCLYTICLFWYNFWPLHGPPDAQTAGIFGSCRDFKVLGPRKPSGSARSTQKRVRNSQSKQQLKQRADLMYWLRQFFSKCFSDFLGHQMNRPYSNITFFPLLFWVCLWPLVGSEQVLTF